MLVPPNGLKAGNAVGRFVRHTYPFQVVFDTSQIYFPASCGKRLAFMVTLSRSFTKMTSRGCKRRILRQQCAELTAGSASANVTGLHNVVDSTLTTVNVIQGGGEASASFSRAPLKLLGGCLRKDAIKGRPQCRNSRRPSIAPIALDLLSS